MEFVLFVTFIFLFLLTATTAFSLTMSSSSRPYCLNLKLSIRPECRDTFLRILQEDQKLALEQESGALQFVLGEDAITSNKFYIHEEYVDKAAFEAHCDTPNFRIWSEFCATNPWSDSGAPVLEFFEGTHEAQKYPNSPTSTYALMVNLYPKPKVREEFMKVIANNKKGTDKNEPLCLQYVWGESTTAPNTFHFYEEYKGNDGGKEGFDAHTKAPHFAAWEKFANTDEPFAQPPDVQFLRTIVPRL